MAERYETELGSLPSSWSLSTVGQLVANNILEKPLDGNHGEIHPKGSDFVESGIPFVMATDITNGKVNLTSCKFITKKQADSLNKGFSVSGDVLLTHKASLGRTAIVGALTTEYIMLTPQVTYYRVKDRSKLDNKYLKHYFDSPVFQDTLINHGDSGSTRAYVGITAQLDLPIILPPPAEQKAIAGVLSSLDDKIDLLHRQNKTLEAMAETLFRQWFIFEAKEDWEEGVLDDILTSIEAGSRPKGGIDPVLKIGVPSVGAESINGIGNYDFSKTKYVTEDFFESMKRGQIKSYDVLVYKDGAYVGRKGMFGNGFPFEVCSVNEHVFILRSNARANQFFLYFLLQQDELSQLNANSAQPGLNQEAMKSFEITIPPQNLIDKFGVIVKPWVDKIFFNSNQIRNLKKLRDTLLPKLMNGEVRVVCGT